MDNKLEDERFCTEQHISDRNLNLFLAVLKGDMLVAQAAIFFTAGFESNATTISFTLCELAMQPHLQTRLRNEILAVMEKNQGRLPYEDIRDMEYMHMVVSGAV